MNTNQNPITNTIFDPQLKLLMSIHHFSEDLERYIQNVEAATRKMTEAYEKGISILKNSADNENEKNWEGLINQNRVNANQLNQILKLAQDKIRSKQKFDAALEWKEFDNREKDLKNSAHNFEHLGVKLLDEANLVRWESEVSIFDNQIEPAITKNAKAVKLIFQFMNKYSPESLERITQIVNKYVPLNPENVAPKDLETSYLKAVQEFQREFKPQNLWDAFLEILAGGVHPSPEERVSLMKQLEGEEKVKKDM
jgi:hypothetical protein